MDRRYFVYFLASGKHRTLYVGVTSDLPRRIYEHKNKLVPGFTSRYNVTKLVYFEVFDNPGAAIAREKQIKKWPREWKIRTIEHENPNWEEISVY